MTTAFGPEHERVATALNNRAGLLLVRSVSLNVSPSANCGGNQALGRLDEALPLFEQYMAVDCGVKTRLVLPEREEERMKQDMIEGCGFDFWQGLFGGINVLNAEATVAQDRDAILQLVKAVDPTGKTVNDLVQLGLKSKHKEIGLSIEVAAGTEEAGNLALSMASLHHALVSVM